MNKEYMRNKTEMFTTMAFAMGISVGVMLGIHTYLLLKNWSTLEVSQLSGNDIFKNQSCL
jgi:hypothetical protein